MSGKKRDTTAPKDGLSEYVAEVEKLREGSYYYVLAATVAPDKDGEPVIIPMMLGDGFDNVKQTQVIQDETGAEQTKTVDWGIHDAFVQCLGQIAKFGFEQLPWEGVDKTAVAMALLQAMGVPIPQPQAPNIPDQQEKGRIITP